MPKSANEILSAIAILDSTWIEKAEEYEKNEKWLNFSSKIAYKILETLRQNRLMSKLPSSQKELAEITCMKPQQVNKILKGQENLTLETIMRLEDSLNIKLIEVANTYKTIMKPIKKTALYLNDNYKVNAPTKVDAPNNEEYVYKQIA